MIHQVYIFQVNTAVGDGKLLMNRIIPQEVDVLLVQVRNGKEQGDYPDETQHHQYRKGHKPALVFMVFHNLHFNRQRRFLETHPFLLPCYPATQVRELMQTEQFRQFL